MKIGVTGCAGFLGSHLVDVLLMRGHEVVGVDNLSMGKRENIVHHSANPSFIFFQRDVRDLDSLRDAFNDAELLVHFAAYKIPRYGNAIETLLINNQGAHNVLEVAKARRCKVVLASTSDVYGKNPRLPFHEESDSVIGPSTVARWSYAVSKLFDEHLAFAYQEDHKLPVVILRFFGSYGPRHHLSWWGGPQSVFISQILRGEEVTIHGDGMQTRSFTYVSDTIRGTVAAIEKDEANGQVFNIGSTHEISIADLARLIHKLSRMPGELEMKFVPYSAFSGGKYEDVRRRIPDIAKAKKMLDFEAQVGLEEGLTSTITWQEEIMRTNGEVKS